MAKKFDQKQENTGVEVKPQIQDDKGASSLNASLVLAVGLKWTTPKGLVSVDIKGGLIQTTKQKRSLLPPNSFYKCSCCVNCQVPA